MKTAFATATLSLFLAMIAAVAARHLRVSSALVEICMGAGVAAIFESRFGTAARQDGLRFLASLGSVLLTFLAGAELEPAALRSKWKEVLRVGLGSFAAPFLGCAAVAR